MGVGPQSRPPGSVTVTASSLGGRRAGGGRRRGGAGLRGHAQPVGGERAHDYTTSDGSAKADVDYTAKSGRLSFQAGESSQTIEVTVLDDDHDEDEETLTLTLSNASSGRLTAGEARGGSRTTIRCRGHCWRGSGGRRRCTWSSTWRNGSRRRASRAPGANSRAGSCGGAWSARWR